ncbi:MAG: EthD family reductase [Spirochaetales bacterium]|nr:EthD family reductase [Spirochaetales bacterium]
MIKVSVMYPRNEKSSFNADYYLNSHIPWVRKALGTALKGIGFEEGIGGREPDSTPAYAAIGHMYFDSVDEYRKAMGPHGEKLRNDIPKFTDVAPIIQISQVKLLNVPVIDL